MTSNSLSNLPDEMFKFTLLDAVPSILAPRLARLSLRAGRQLATPHYLPISSRGALPHVSHDNIRDDMSICGLYVALEDCKIRLLEKCLV